MWLDDDAFRQVLAATPLFSLDLIVRRPDGRVLLGCRRNRPARDYWFVPGGRVRKNESLDDAFTRLTSTELGLVLPRGRARLLGLYEHFYSDSVFGETPSTHYVVAGHLIEVADDELPPPPPGQHRDYRWWSVNEALASTEVHPFTRDYMKDLS